MSENNEPKAADVDKSVNTKWTPAKIGAVAVGVVSFVFTVVQLYDRFTHATRPEINASAKWIKFELPSQMWERVAAEIATERNATWDEAWEVAWRSVSEDEPIKANDEIMVNLRDKSRRDRSFSDGRISDEFDWLENMLVISINNASEITANKVRVIMGESEGITTVEREREDPEHHSYKNEIIVGTIEGGDGATVTVWPKSFFGDDIEVRIKDEIISVPTRADNSPSFLSFFIGLLAFWVLAVIALDYVQSKQKVSDLQRQLTAGTHGDSGSTAAPTG
jgi:hypothetical protein